LRKNLIGVKLYCICFAAVTLLGAIRLYWKIFGGCLLSVVRIEGKSRYLATLRMTKGIDKRREYFPAQIQDKRGLRRP
jgi:hypothetical protein